MTNTVEFTEWSELLNHATNGTVYARILREFLNEDVVEKLIRHEAYLTSTYNQHCTSNTHSYV